MTRFPLAAAAAFALLALSACDSTDTVDPETPPAPPPTATSPLVGSWTLSGSTTKTFVTVSEAQVLVDQSGPVTGTVSTTGAQTVTFRYMEVNPFYGEARLTSYNPRGPEPDVRYNLNLTRNGYSSLSVYRFATGTLAQYGVYTEGVPFTYADGRLTVQPLTLEQVYGQGNGTVTVAAGTLAYPTMPLAAGQPTLARTDTFDDPGQNDFRYVFQADGVYRAERDEYPNRTVAVVGTWVAEGAQLRLSVTDRQTVETETFQYAIEGGRLRLGVSADGCRDDTYCLQSREQEFGLRPGTLRQIRSEFETVFVPTTAATAPTRAAEAPAFLSARREAAVWPRALAHAPSPM